MGRLVKHNLKNTKKKVNI